MDNTTAEGCYPQRPLPPRSKVEDAKCDPKEELVKLREKQLGSNGYEGN